jgi:hypothetical protein
MNFDHEIRVTRNAFARLQILVLLAFFSGSANAADWKAVDDASVLRELFSDTILQATLKDGVKAEATYNSDSTGELRAWESITAIRMNCLASD